MYGYVENQQTRSESELLEEEVDGGLLFVVGVGVVVSKHDEMGKALTSR